MSAEHGTEDDYYRLDDTLSGSERELRDRVRAFGDNDVRDRVVLSGVWSLDSYAQGISSGFWHALASGWTLSSIISYQSGQPYTPNVNSDLNNDGNPSNDIAPGFRRNSLRLPYQFSIDPRVTRDIGIYGGARLQLIAEAFNLTNHLNVVGRNGTWGNNADGTPLSTFGQPLGGISNVDPGREYQFSIRARF